MRTTSLLALLLTAGCMGELELSESVAYTGTRCPITICGGNSQEVARNGMHEANLFGEYDENKISLETNHPASANREPRAQIWDAAGQPYDLHVKDGRLLGVDPSSGSILKSENLIGAKLHVLQSGQPAYHIRIDGVRMIQTPVGEPDPIEVYTMVWLPQGSNEEGQLCGVPEVPFDDKKDQDQLLGMRSDETLVFEGDRIDAKAKTMNPNPEWNPSWFNFGCAGRTLAKLRLLRKTQGNGSGDWASRQTALKMMAADYCGKGQGFTRTGTRIGWKDAEGLVDYVRTPTVIEARWNQHGATCVSTPRRLSAVPYVWDYINATCLPISCDLLQSTASVYDLGDAKIITALYD